MSRKPDFVPLPEDARYEVILSRGLPKKYVGRVIGEYPGGALCVVYMRNGRAVYRKYLPQSVVRKP